MITVVVGLQWGDEGKGKIVDTLISTGWVVRYQGGANAGHTVYKNGTKFVFHQLPSGILNPEIKNGIAAGCVVDPEILIEEIESITQKGINISNRFFIDSRVPLVLKFHKLIDKAIDKKRGIGVTGRGIGPTQADRARRWALRMEDLFLKENDLKDKLNDTVEFYNFILNNYYKEKQEIKIEDILSTLGKFKSYLTEENIIDLSTIIQNAIDNKQKILFESAQGSLLDINFGTYPFVTSSHPISGGIYTGVGLPPQKFDRVIGVMKAYTTRVGSGPFPSRVPEKIESFIVDIGMEYGATTGRKRRCGWLDLELLKKTIRLNGVTEIALTKLDVLSGLNEIKILIEKENEYKYKIFKGWNKDIKDIKTFSQLPYETKKYIYFIEEALEIPIKLISVGKEKEQIIMK